MFKALFIIFLVSPVMAFAHGNQHPTVTGQLISIQGSPSQKDIAALIENAHSNMEPEAKGFLQKIVTSANIKQLSLAAYRWASANYETNPKARDHIVNLAFYLPLSHIAEMHTGPIGLFVANQMGASPEVMAGIGAVGTAMWMPFVFDPYEWVFLGLYAFEPMRNMFTLTRIGIFKVAKGTYRRFGGAYLANKFFESISRVDYLTRQLSQNSNVEIHQTYKGEVVETQIRIQDNWAAEMELTIVEKEGQAPFLDRLRIDQEFLLSKNISLKGLGYNVREAVEKILQDPESEQRRFHIQSIEALDSGHEIRFKPSALPLRNKWVRKGPRLKCSSI